LIACGEIELPAASCEICGLKNAEYLSDLEEAYCVSDIRKIKLVSQINILWGLIPVKAAIRCKIFYLQPHLKIKIALQDRR